MMGLTFKTEPIRAWTRSDAAAACQVFQCFQGKDHFGIGPDLFHPLQNGLEVPAGPVSPGGRQNLEAFAAGKGHRIDDTDHVFF